MRGRNGLSSRLPAAAAAAMVASLLMTTMAAWLTASGMTGFTLPGMMEEPACRWGSRISPMPASGPEDSRRRSPLVLSRVTASALRIPETSTNTSAFWVASTRFSARAKPTPERSRSSSTTRKMNWRGAARPVPDGGAAQVDHAQPLLALVDAPAVPAEGLGVGAHLAAQGDEHGVLHLGAGHLDHVGVALLQLLEGLLQRDHVVLEVVEQPDGRQAQGRRDRCRWWTGGG